MIITQHPKGPAKLPRRLQPPVPPPPTVTRGEVFMRSSSRCARTLAQVGGVTNGASLGYLAGAMFAGSRATSGPVAWGCALAGAAAGGAIGWGLMGKVSDWAGNLALRVAPKHPLQAELAGRTALNLAVDLLSGSPVTAAIDLSVTAGWGGIQAARHKPA